MKKYLFVITALAGGGLEEVLLGIIEHMDLGNSQVDILTFQGRDMTMEYKFIAYGCNIYKTKALHEDLIGFVQKVYHLSKANHYDSVSSMIDIGGIFTAMSSLVSGVKNVICHSHNNYWPERYKKFEYPIKLAYKLLPIKKVADTLEAAQMMFGSAKGVTIIKNGIDINKFAFHEEERIRLRKELYIDDKFVIGNIGRLSAQKNHKKQIGIFKEILKQREHSILILIGDGEDKEKIQSMIEESNLQDKVWLLGYQETINQYLQVFDLFLFPSCYEGLGIALIDAQCAGLPCVASTNVPKEADITGNVKFVPLEAENKKWADIILEFHDNFTRSDQRMKIKAAGYDREETYIEYVNML